MVRMNIKIKIKVKMKIKKFNIHYESYQNIKQIKIQSIL